MAISREGRRRIVVGGRVFYWDYRVAGSRPGKGPIWDWPPEQRPNIVVVVSEDKRWRLAVQTSGGYRVQIDPGGKAFRLADSEVRAIRRGAAITPAFARRLIEKYFPPPA